MNTFLKLKGKEKQDFLQSKYEYYRTYNTYAVIVACLASITYFISDCQLFGRFAWETLLPRCFILIPLAIFLFINSRCHNYKIMTVLSELMVHMIMWCTIWAIVYLPDKTHASEGFIIMQLVFLAISFCAPFGLSTISNFMIIGNILISNTFNHYENLDIMLSLGLPCIFGITATNYVLSGMYYDNYITKHQLEDSLVLDPLTKVYNRHKLPSISKDGKFTFERNEIVSILMTDIDHFKDVNDTYGHDKGDIVLQSVANVIKSCTRSGDYIIRWGGEEFVVIMPNCGIMEASYVAERIRLNVEADDNSVCPITISIGVAQYDKVHYKNAIKQADTALYQAKENGRNRVVCFKD